MRIESGPNTERSVRNLLMLLMVAFFAAWFAYDGWVGYPRKNFDELLDQLPPDVREKARTATVHQGVNESALAGIDSAMKSPSVDEIRTGLTAALGGPPSLETDQAWYYFGPALGYKFSIERGRPVRFMAMKTPKSEMDIRLQQIIAICLMVLTAYLTTFNIWIRRTRMVLDDAGLTCSGSGPIPWQAMKSMDISRFAAKGWVDLAYDDRGAVRKLRINEYHHSAFDDVIDAICKQKGFENPLPLPEPEESDSKSQS